MTTTELIKSPKRNYKNRFKNKKKNILLLKKANLNYILFFLTDLISLFCKNTLCNLIHKIVDKVLWKKFTETFVLFSETFMWFCIIKYVYRLMFSLFIKKK